MTSVILLITFLLETERLTPYLARHHTFQFRRGSYVPDAGRLKIWVDREVAALASWPPSGHHSRLPLENPEGSYFMNRARIEGISSSRVPLLS